MGKNFLTLIRIFFKYETDEKTGAKIFDDEFESFFGLSMFSKNFNKSSNSMEKNLHKNINNYKLIIRWTRQFLIESL